MVKIAAPCRETFSKEQAGAKDILKKRLNWPIPRSWFRWRARYDLI